MVVLAAYGALIPEAVLDRALWLNVHPSLLPRWRGAAPIERALMAGDAETGVTIMRMVPALDAGPIIFQARTPVLEDETYGELSLRLSELGALTLVEALSLMELGGAHEQPQDESLATYASKIDRAATWVDWTAPAANVCRLIRSLDPRPGARTTMRGTEVKLFGARLAPHAMSTAPGRIQSIDDEGLVVACGEGAARLSIVQPAGKRRLTPNDWARGRGAAVGDRFETAPAAVS
jgi:methionyl-tRNA formyltransferase